MARPPGPILKIGAPIAGLTCAAVIVGVFWGLDWRWIPTTLVAAVALLLVGAFVEIELDRRAEDREAAEARRTFLAAQEEDWLTGRQEQP
jgi:hypothetical protein